MLKKGEADVKRSKANNQRRAPRDDGLGSVGAEASRRAKGNAAPEALYVTAISAQFATSLVGAEAFDVNH